MTPVLWILVGVAGMFVLSIVCAALARFEDLDVIVGAVVALIAAPVVALAFLIEKTQVSTTVSLSPDALARFAKMRNQGGGRAWVFSYRRHGVILVRGLRDNTKREKPKPYALKARDVFDGDTEEG